MVLRTSFLRTDRVNMEVAKSRIEHFFIDVLIVLYTVLSPPISINHTRMIVRASFPAFKTTSVGNFRVQLKQVSHWLFVREVARLSVRYFVCTGRTCLMSYTSQAHGP